MRKEGIYTLFETLSNLHTFWNTILSFFTMRPNRESEYELNKKNVPNNWHVSSDERKTGLEPATPTLGRSCSTNWATFAFKSERKTGLEPATLTLARLCSTNWAIFAFTIPIKNSSVGYSQLRCKSNTFFLKAKKIREIFPASRMKSLKRPSPLVFCHIFRNFDTLN